MTLSASTRLGPYEIMSPLVAGGMGEVYFTHDGESYARSFARTLSRLYLVKGLR